MPFCGSCGAQYAEGQSFCGKCGAPVSGAPAPARRKQEPKRTHGWLIVVGVLLLIGWAFQAASEHGAQPASPAPHAKAASPAQAAQAQRNSADQECADLASAYLALLKQGHDASAAMAWKPNARPKSLFDVRSFHSLTSDSVGPFVRSNGRPYKPRRVYATFEVESSTRGGFPIHKRWNIVLEPGSKDLGGQSCAIVDLQPAE